MNVVKKDEIRLELIANSKNGIAVFYDPVYSHAATHVEDTPQLKELVSEIIQGLELQGQKIATHIDMGRIVGTTDVVETNDSDEIVYGMRKNRSDDGLVPFTKSREGEPCQYVAVQLEPQQDGSYILASAWIGTFGDDDEPFPQSPDATERSINFWDKHAFVYGSQEIVEGTETQLRPW
jgi:hypothetical protein